MNRLLIALLFVALGGSTSVGLVWAAPDVPMEQAAEAEPRAADAPKTPAPSDYEEEAAVLDSPALVASPQQGWHAADRPAPPWAEIGRPLQPPEQD